jgi:PAS domain S-box-containing protein
MQEGVSFLMARLHPDDLNQLVAENGAALQHANENDPRHDGEQVAEFTYRVKHADGSYRWLRTYGTVFTRNAEKKVEQVMNISIDVTNEYALRKDLEDERRFAHLLIENSPDMILAYDKQFNIIAWNKKCEEHTKIRKKDAIGKNTFDLFPEYRNTGWVESMEEVFRGKSLHYPRVKFLHKDGYGESFVMPLKDANEAIQGLLSITRDITEQVKNEQQLQKRNDELKRSEERYIRMTEEVVDYAVLLLDKDGTIENWNRGAQKIKGYEASEIIGKNFRLFYTREDRERMLPEKLINERVRMAALHMRAGE